MREYKINMDRTDPTPEEIAKNKDFSKVLDNYSALSGPVYTKTWFLSTAALVLAAGLLIVINLVNSGDKPVKDPEQSYVYQPTDIEQITEAPYVNPPLEGVNIGYETYIVESGKKSKLKYSTGTKIKVPKNAFVNADGDVIEGEVEIKYREFHDVADFFVSGIPMDYDSAGVNYHFESAGMMEILAFQNGEPVFIKPDKDIKIEMASDYESTHYNLYELDPENRKWVLRGKDQVTPSEGTDVQPEPTVAAEFTEDGIADTYYSDQDRPNPIVPEQELPVKKLVRNLKIAQVAVERVKKTKPFEPVAVSKERYNFDIAVEAKEFPEISVYEGTRFEIGDENTNFNAKMYDVAWEDVLLEENIAGVNYNLTLSKGKTKYTWIVYPVFEGKDLEKAQKVYKQKFDAYKEKLSTRVIAEKKAEDLYMAKLEEYEKKRLEQLALWKEQKRQYELAQKNQNERMRTRQKAIRAFSITSFGTWNCDSPVKKPSGRSVAATFTDEEGNLLQFTNVYLVQRDQNAMFTYDYSMFKKLKFNPKEENVLWAVTADNRLAIFHSDRFTEIPKGGKFTFKMHVLKNEMGSVAEVKEAISI